MTGLLLKDLYTLRQYGKTMLFMFALFSVISCGLDNPASFFEGFMILMSMMITITSFSYDELAKWNHYLLTLPVSRREIVGAKYLLSIVLCLTGAVLSFAVSSAVLMIHPVQDFGLKEHLLSILILICIAMLFILILLPFIFRFGVEKSRLIMFAVFAAPTAAVVVFGKTGASLPSEATLLSFAKVLPLLIVLLYLLSFYLSERIFSKKEL